MYNTVFLFLVLYFRFFSLILLFLLLLLFLYAWAIGLKYAVKCSFTWPHSEEHWWRWWWRKNKETKEKSIVKFAFHQSHFIAKYRIYMRIYYRFGLLLTQIRPYIVSNIVSCEFKQKEERINKWRYIYIYTEAFAVNNEK